MRKEMIELYVKSIITFLILISSLFFVLKFLERKRFLCRNSIENAKVIPISSEDRIVVFTYNGEEFVIFSTSGSAILLDKKTIRKRYTVDEVQIQKDDCGVKQ